MGIGGRVVLVALLAASLLSPGGGILHERSIEENARRFVKRQDAGGRHIQPSLELRKRLNEARPFSYRPAEELGSRTARSDDQDSSCDLKMTALLETNPMSLSETADTIQAVWVENDNILIVASDAGKAVTTVWLGVPKDYGIFTFTPHSNLIKGAVATSSLQVASSNRKRALVVAQDKKTMFVTSNGGLNWIQVSLPALKFDETEDLIMSEVSPDHIFLSANNELYHSRSAGEQWQLVSYQVQMVKLVKKDDRHEYLFYLVPGRPPGLNVLHRLAIPSGESEILDRRVYRFAVKGRYLFVSRQNFTGSSSTDEASRRMYVCSNIGAAANDIEFSEVQLPSITPQQFYVIMATHETGAFIHVNLQSEKGSGGLYVSDSSGTRFSLSLSNHFYKVFYIKALDWRYAVDDFYEVNSMRGVYITTAVSDDSAHTTMITFNNGAEWSRLRPPSTARNCRHPTCSLHLHLYYSHMTAGDYNQSYSSSSPMLSIETAVGIIIGHGSYGEKRNDSEPHLVVSNDGGYSWKDPGLPVGTYVYGIADYGNIIAVAPDSQHVDFIWFSHNRGDCFVKQVLDTTHVFSLSRGLLMDPRASSLTAFVMGVEGDGAGDEWRMITLNFKRLLQRKCVSKDYVSWSEHATADSCLLGYKDTYNITKTSSICYNEQGYHYKPVSHERCACSYDDLECDFGYNRTASNKCEQLNGYNLADDCPPGAKYVNQTKSGFRLIPGDRCIPTNTSRRVLKWEMVECSGHEEESGYDNDVEARRRIGASAGRIVGGVIIALVILAVAVVSFYGFLRCRVHIPSTYEKVLYQKLPVMDPVAGEDASSSDEDLIDTSSPQPPANPFENT